MMQPRIRNPAMIVPDAMKALHALGASAEKGGLPSRTHGLVHLRASQMNGDSTCVDSHPRLLKKAGESDERLFALAAWRDAPYFTDAERAALALTEAVRRMEPVEAVAGTSVCNAVCNDRGPVAANVGVLRAACGFRVGCADAARVARSLWVSLPTAPRGLLVRNESDVLKRSRECASATDLASAGYCAR